MKNHHKIWQVRIVSRDDPGSIFDKPVRAMYLIESKFKNGLKTIYKRALALAADDGIPNPVVAGLEWINSPYIIKSPEEL